MPARSAEPVLSVIVVSWNTRELLRACLASIERHLGALARETIVVDNASSDGSAEMVETEFPTVRLLRNVENVGFGSANNLAMAQARGDYFLLLNSDAELLDDGAVRLVERLRERPDVGVASLRLVLPDGRLQASARRFPSLWTIALAGLWLHRLMPRRRAADLLLGHHWGHDAEREADWVTGACMLVRKEVFRDTGGFDPTIFLYGEELEWCHRAGEKGWKVLFAPLGRVLHHDHQSADRLLGTTGRIDRCLLAEDRLVARWQGPLAGGTVPIVRIAGALARLVGFGARALVAGDDDYGRDVRSEARSLLGHYGRRLRGAIDERRPGG